MKKIKKQFNQFGWNFTLLARTKNAALYKRTKGKNIEAYEVHKIRIVNVFGKTRERLAQADAFGWCGWGYGNLNPAIEKFNELTIKHLRG